jgi:NTP pyrophosphatase (non-canonical NTP hydrolase)
MSMTNNGLSKMVEECGELIQIAGKMLQYSDTDVHPDGNGSMLKRLEDEMGDVLAATLFVRNKLKLDHVAIGLRAKMKYDLYEKWDKEV